MARPVDGIIWNLHLVNDRHPGHAAGTMDPTAEVAGAMPALHARRLELKVLQAAGQEAKEVRLPALPRGGSGTGRRPG